MAASFGSCGRSTRIASGWDGREIQWGQFVSYTPHPLWTEAEGGGVAESYGVILSAYQSPAYEGREITIVPVIRSHGEACQRYGFVFDWQNIDGAQGKMIEGRWCLALHKTNTLTVGMGQVKPLRNGVKDIVAPPWMMTKVCKRLLSALSPSSPGYEDRRAAHEAQPHRGMQLMATKVFRDAEGEVKQPVILLSGHRFYRETGGLALGVPCVKFEAERYMAARHVLLPRNSVNRVDGYADMTLCLFDLGARLNWGAVSAGRFVTINPAVQGQILAGLEKNFLAVPDNVPVVPSSSHPDPAESFPVRNRDRQIPCFVNSAALP